MKNKDINMAMLGVFIGQLNEDIEPWLYIEEIVKYAQAFTKWEKENVLSLEDGWETYQDQGGEDFESTIYQWAKEFEV